MRKLYRVIRSSLFIAFSAMLLTACGGGSSGGGSEASTLNGTAAVGVPIVGTIQVTGSAGNTAIITIDISGNFSIDVSGLTAPFIISAVADNSNEPSQFSLAFNANETVNVTPLTTLALFNAYGNQDLAGLEANWATLFSGITQQQIDNAVAIINANFASLFTNAGLDPAAFDIFSTAFNADGAGFDGILDLLNIIFNFVNGSFTVLVDGQPAFSFDPDIDTSGFGGSGNVDLSSVTFGSDGATDLGFSTFAPQTNETTTINIAGTTTNTLIWERVEGSSRYKLSIAIINLNNGSLPTTRVIFDVFTVGESAQTHIWSSVVPPQITIGFDDVVFNNVSLLGGVTGSANFNTLTINGTLNRDRSGL